MQVAGSTSELKEMIENFPDPEHLSSIDLTCNDDLFLEVLMSNIRNAIISFQTWVRKVENAKVNHLIKNINSLKVDLDSNANEIFELEKELTDVSEKRLSEKIKQIKLYECLHDEKPSPLFLTLVKNRNGAKLKVVKDKDGNEYESEFKRMEGICKFYEELFEEEKNDANVNFESCIGDFLGPEIIASPLVNNSKLSANESVFLDRPLSLEELDNAMEKANMRSAAGFDGYSMQLIRKGWKFFRYPLKKYFDYCLETGSLTDNFRSACIRLIPKKGDLSDLKNWRPISLLSNMYKILSRALNMRLESVVNRICSRAQKGYNKKRYAQEVIINVCESISYCKANDINGGLVAIDMAKAFDSLSHKFLNAVLKFFGFGENMIKMLELVGNNRQACILGDTGINSRYFKLGRGRAQGDNLSPNTFNFGEQILIFKIELDPRIKSIPRNVERIINYDDVHFSQECNRETGKNESLADDNSTIQILDREGIRAIKEILNDFALISGLKCNYDKTVIMPFLDVVDPEIIEEVSGTGFRLASEIELLGVKITKNIADMDENFRKAKEKIVSKILFWDRFKLSLAGRIAVAKTFMVPVINYIGCVIEPSNTLLDEIQELIDTFVRKNLKISKDRMYLTTNLGGVGMFNLRHFLAAQRFLWLVRAYKLPIDNWRYDIIKLSPNFDVTLLRTCDVDKTCNPILFGMAKCFSEIVSKFSKKNYFSAHFFDNDQFKIPGTNDNLTLQFFGRNVYEQNKGVIRRLTLKECLIDNRVKTRDEFENMGLQLSPALWFSFSNAIRYWYRNRRAETGNADQDGNIRNFMDGLKKGSKKIRDTIAKIENSVDMVLELSSFKTHMRLTGCEIADPETVSRWLQCWNKNLFPNDFKTFLYNCRYNSLPLNNRLHAYLPEIDRRCTFCRIKDSTSTTTDGYRHCFFLCITTRQLLTDWLTKVEFNVNIDTLEFERLFWYGSTENGFDFVKLTIFEVFRYAVFKSRLGKNIPNVTIIDSVIKTTLSKLCLANKKFRNLLLSNESLAGISRAIG
jgi:hypothetical protein